MQNQGIKMSNFAKYENVIYAAAAAIIIAAGYSFYHHKAGPQPKQTVVHPLQTQDKPDKTAEAIEPEQNNLTQKLKAFDEGHYAELLKYSPLGYTLFAIDKDKNVGFLRNDRVPPVCQISWDKVAVEEITDKRITLRFDTIYDFESGNSYMNSPLSIPRNKNSVHPALKIGKLSINTEMLNEDNDGMMCLMTFVREEKKKESGN